MNKSDKEKLMKLFAIIGALVAIIEAIIGLINGAAGLLGMGIVGSILALVLAIIVCYSVFKPDDPIPYNAVMLLILGILLIIFSSLIGGILLIIGAIFGLIK